MALSRSAVDKLGERLRAGDTTEADWTLLEELRSERQRHLDEVVVMLRSELGVEVTSRVKTINTLVEKLKRESLRFSQMDDLAGARIKIDGTRLDQDAIVDRLLAIWPAARVKDRRTQPVHGYRAVHIIPTVDGWPLEIQVRTVVQDIVANQIEGLADRWGRAIRYGGKPDDPEKQESNGLTRQAYLDEVIRFAARVADFERIDIELAEIRPLPASERLAALDELEPRAAKIHADLLALLEIVGLGHQ